MRSTRINMPDGYGVDTAATDGMPMSDEAEKRIQETCNHWLVTASPASATRWEL